jgi:hypothetical protein
MVVEIVVGAHLGLFRGPPYQFSLFLSVRSTLGYTGSTLPQTDRNQSSKANVAGGPNTRLYGNPGRRQTALLSVRSFGSPCNGQLADYSPLKSFGLADSAELRKLLYKSYWCNIACSFDMQKTGRIGGLL